MGPLRRLASAAQSWLHRLPFKPMLLLTVGCLVIKEEYPFSNFPMYSSFRDSTYYVYLTDDLDQPLSTYEATGMSTPTLKKVFAAELRMENKRAREAGVRDAVQERKRAAERVLTRLKTAAHGRQPDSGAPTPRRLYEVNISLENGGYEKRATLLAEVR